MTNPTIARGGHPLLHALRNGSGLEDRACEGSEEIIGGQG